MRRPEIVLSLSFSILLLGGCHKASVTAGSANTGPLLTPAQMEAIRVDLDKGIPPPTKSRYLGIRSMSEWENPSITVQADMLSVHVLMPDGNPSDYGKGTLIRPVAARKQELQVRVGDLPAALNAIPHDAWPYGRVIAIEEAHDAPKGAVPEVRRTMERTMQMLGTLGVVVNETLEPGSISLR